jgi:integrase/recombinase XerC
MAGKARVIQFAAEPAVIAAVGKWQAWLKDEKRFSAHTLDAYSRDLSAFFAFLADHLGYPPGLKDLRDLEANDFRGWLAARARRGLSKTSSARALSTLRGFFRWMERNDLAHNPAIAGLRTPRIE